MREAVGRGGDPGTLERFSIRLNRQRSRFSLILRMILSEKSATFRDHALDHAERLQVDFENSLLFRALGLVLLAQAHHGAQRLHVEAVALGLMLLPSSIRSNPLLMSVSGTVWVIIGSISILPSMSSR